MKERPSTFSSSGAARDENHVERSEVWNGEPRVIYHDVENRLESLKRARRLAHAGAVGPGPGSAASAMGKEDEEIASSMRDRFGPLDDEIVHDAKRFVDVIFDPPGEMYGYFQGESQVPRVEVMVVDRRGQERRAVYNGGEMERVEVGSVIVVRDPKAGSEVPIAAYLVGDENYQVGNMIGRSLLVPVRRSWHYLSVIPVRVAQALGHAGDADRDVNLRRPRDSGGRLRYRHLSAPEDEMFVPFTGAVPSSQISTFLPDTVALLCRTLRVSAGTEPNAWCFRS